MKNLSTQLLITFFGLLLITGCSMSYYANRSSKNEKKELKRISAIAKNQRKELPKAARPYVEEMQYIPGGSLEKGNHAEKIFANEEDTTLLVGIVTTKESIAAFYMSKHEVTNAEYREFVNWVRDSIALNLLGEKDPAYYLDASTKRLNWQRRKELWKGEPAQELSSLYKPDEIDNGHSKLDVSKLGYTFTSNGEVVSLMIYPDTLVWTTDWKHAANEPMAQQYFSHPAYKYYPVVGVTWMQANAYCHWRTIQFNNKLAGKVKGTNKSQMLTAEFRLPTESEWEYAALANVEDDSQEYRFMKQVFPWKGSDTRGFKGRYQANFGKIIAQNGLVLKSYIDDGGLYPVAAEPGHGNFRIYPPNNYGLYHMAGNVAEWTSDNPVAQTITTLEAGEHNKMVLAKNPRPRVVKGGSWADPPAYLLCASREVYSEEKPSSRIGFRVVMSVKPVEDQNKNKASGAI